MAERCGECGSADTSTGLHSFTCLVCGAVTAYAKPEDRGRVPNPDGPAHYHGDDGHTYHGDPVPEPAPVKSKKR